jgi:hypothetical protein
MEQTDDKTESSAPETANKASQNKDSQNEELPNELTFEKLTPTDQLGNEMQGYTQALDFIFKEDDLRNIAITGPYASGKSSVIKTYEKKLNELNIFKKLNGIHISLAYFSPALESKIKGKKKVDELIFEDELMLERKIINQLIHQIDPNEVPDTKFRIKSEPKKKSNAFWAGIISFLIFNIIFFDKAWLTNLPSVWHTLALIILLFLYFCSTAYVFYTAIDLQIRRKLISKLKIFENEIDMSSSACEVSYFDKYLDEIIYILNKSQLDYIVFEDIDRYDDNLILNKLKELNSIYNKKHRKNNPKPIKFFYLIKDEIFESKDRTKFFDYILPIVPVMDNANSLGKIEQIFKKRNIRTDFSTPFLDTLSLYLDDIRLIKNICNEYIIYKTKIAHNDSEFKNENLLAIIVYKNMFPADFSLTRLGLGQGVVHRIIDSLVKQKNKYCQKEIQKIDDGNKQLKLPNKITEFIEIKQNEGIQIEDLFKKHIKKKTKQPEYKAEYEKLSSSCYFPLLRVLIIQGYIDEYYSDYTSAYNEHGLPRNDILFLRNIYERKSSDKGNWKLELTKPELVFERLKRYKNIYFNREYVLNYSLLDYILVTRKVDELENLSVFIRLLEPLDDNQVLFINEYLERYYYLLIKETITLVSLQAQTLSQIQVEILLQKMKIKIVLPQIQIKDELVQEARAQGLEAQRLEAQAQAQELEAQGLEAQAQGLEARAQELEARAQEARAQGLEAQAQGLEEQAQELEEQAQELEEQAQELEEQAQEARREEAYARTQKAFVRVEEAFARAQEVFAQEAQAREAFELEAQARARARVQKARAQETRAKAQEARAQGLEALTQGLEALTQGLEARAQAQEALELEARAQAQEARAQAQEALGLEVQAQEALGLEEVQAQAQEARTQAQEARTQAKEVLIQAQETLIQAQETPVLAKQEARYPPEYLGLLIQQLNQRFPRLWQKIQEPFFDQKLYFYLLFIYDDDLSTLSEMNEEQTLKERIEDSVDFLLIKDEWHNILNFNNYWLNNIAKISIAFEALNIKFKKIDQSIPQLLEVVEAGNHYVLNQANVLHILENLYAHKNSTTYIIQTLLELNKSAPVKSYFQRNPEELVLSITASEDIVIIDDNEETVLFILNHKYISSEAKIAYIDKLSTVITELNQITDEEIREKLRQKQK